MNLTKPLVAAGLAGALIATGGAVPAAAAAGYDRTSAAEARRVDRVPTPRLDWTECNEIAECATVRLPLDYDHPNGATTQLAVRPIKARDQAHRVGSLFLNPGGPGGSATDFVLAAPFFLDPLLLDRFDIVGVDPRGIGHGDILKCWSTSEEQEAALAPANFPFPVGADEERRQVEVSEVIGRACSTTGKPLSGSISTAEVARDMDVVRRAVGDAGLNFLGFSYGSQLGQVYANMFPDRVRAVVVDGVLDAVAWTAARDGRKHILDERLRSSDGAYRALVEIFRRCASAGEARCSFAAGGDPAAKWRTIVDELKAEPLTVVDGGVTFTVTYADFVAGMQGTLYNADAGNRVAAQAQEIYELVTNRGDAAKQRTLARHITQARLTAADEDYASDGGLAVICTDGLEPRRASQWIAATARGDERAPDFGRSWGWLSSPCANSTWTVRDEDAYLGPFNKRTKNAVLFVGSYWDPATNYDGSVSASRRQPGARLISSNNWGHTAYGTSRCADEAIDGYLVTATAPAADVRCDDAAQPFAGPTAIAAERRRPPLATPKPKSILDGTR